MFFGPDGKFIQFVAVVLKVVLLVAFIAAALLIAGTADASQQAPTPPAISEPSS
ncbi:hypothetical protein [Actinomadura sp. KC216]|uniref:hypothetical protein n=1 Tax=Actinomadura sp. KC216 TaxID=2530370 RepID=UPI0014049DCD|nr:hypothetical protein [Actinomadura sp. KC216]